MTIERPATSWDDDDSSWFDEQEALEHIWTIRALQGKVDPGPLPPEGWPPDPSGKPLEEHYGPGAHPGTGTPQSVHGEHGEHSGAEARLARAEGGFTFDLQANGYVKTGYAVSVHANRGAQMQAFTDADPAAIREFIDAFIARNADLLQVRGNMVGGWVDDGVLYLDVSSRAAT